MQFFEGNAGISHFLEQADGGDAGGTRFDAGFCVIQSHAADGQDGDRDGAANFGEGGQTLRRAELFF